MGVSVLFNGNKIWPAAEEYAVITQADTITEFPDLGVLSFNTGDKLTVRITHLEGYYSQSDIVRLTPAVSSSFGKRRPNVKYFGGRVAKHGGNCRAPACRIKPMRRLGLYGRRSYGRKRRPFRLCGG